MSFKCYLILISVIIPVGSFIRTRKDLVDRHGCSSNGWVKQIMDMKALLNLPDDFKMDEELKCYESVFCPDVNQWDYWNSEGRKHQEHHDTVFVEPEARDFQKEPLQNYEPYKHMACDPESLNRVGNKTLLCPGNRMPVGHEQRCFGGDLEDDYSGQCMHPGGICYKGFCCPGVNTLLQSQPLKPYISRVKCNPICRFPANWKLAFCDPILLKVVFIGEQPLYSNEKLRDYLTTDPQNCTEESCPTGFVCVMNEVFSREIGQMIPSEECWPNPLRPLPPEDTLSGFILIMLILLLLVIIVFLSYVDTPDEHY